MSYFIDAHCHPVLKYYLFDGKYSLFKESNGHEDNNYTNNQVTVPAMRKAQVDAVLAAHYLPEKLIPHYWKTAQLVVYVLKRFIKKFIEKVEPEDAYCRTLKMIKNFEEYIQDHSDEAVIAHSFQDLKTLLGHDRKIFIHVLEGAHHLGRDQTLDVYLKRIDELKHKGVALLTIAHFFPNTIVYPCEGIPPRTKKQLKVTYKLHESVPLDNLGIGVIEGLLEKGILVDLTHTNPTARQKVFELNRKRGKENMRPLVFSHVGVRALFKDPNPRNNKFGNMCPTDDEILAIQECNGMIGVIFMNYWLSGIEEKPGSKRDFGIPLIMETIKHIHCITKSFDNIGIGTDFDGLNDPPDDCYDTSMLGIFKVQLSNPKYELNATPSDIDKILGGNLLRVLEKGWT